MKHQLALAACLLLLWTLTECADPAEQRISVKQTGGGIEVICPAGNHLKKKGQNNVTQPLTYSDENSGEYECADDLKIFVRFRTCDNCIELDEGSIIGMVVGDVVATIVIGVAVYLIASQSGNSPITSQKKSSDRQHLVSNEVTGRAPNEHYEPLRPKGAQKDTYDVITSRK